MSDHASDLRLMAKSARAKGDDWVAITPDSLDEIASRLDGTKRFDWPTEAAVMKEFEDRYGVTPEAPDVVRRQVNRQREIWTEAVKWAAALLGTRSL